LTKSDKGNDIDLSILETMVHESFLCLPIKDQYNKLSLFGFTEYRCGEMLFRSHPNYHNDGAWFDHVMVAWDITNEKMKKIKSKKKKYDNDDDSMQDRLISPVLTADNTAKIDVNIVPAQIFSFVKTSDDALFAILQSCHEKSKKDSVITYCWKREYKEDQKPLNTDFDPYKIEDDNSLFTLRYRCVSVDSIQRHCLTVPYHPTSKFLMEILEKEKWSKSFLTFNLQ